MSSYHPYMYYPPHGHQCCYWPYYTYTPVTCSTCCQPLHACHCQKALTPMKTAKEVEVDDTTPSKEALVGGLEDASLSLEYLKTGPNPTIKISITEAGSTATWDIGTISDEYQSKENFANVAPGAAIKIEVKDCHARVRWCEVICC